MYVGVDDAVAEGPKGKELYIVNALPYSCSPHLVCFYTSSNGV